MENRTRDIDFLPCTNQRKQVKQNLGHSCYQAMHNTSKWEVCFTSLSCNHMLLLSSPTPFLFTFPCKTVTLQLSPNCTSTICSYSSSSASFVFFSICTLSSCTSTDHQRALPENYILLWAYTKLQKFLKQRPVSTFELYVVNGHLKNKGLKNSSCKIKICLLLYTKNAYSTWGTQRWGKLCLPALENHLKLFPTSYRTPIFWESKVLCGEKKCK